MASVAADSEVCACVCLHLFSLSEPFNRYVMIDCEIYQPAFLILPVLLLRKKISRIFVFFFPEMLKMLT